MIWIDAEQFCISLNKSASLQVLQMVYKLFLNMWIWKKNNIIFSKWMWNVIAIPASSRQHWTAGACISLIGSDMAITRRRDFKLRIIDAER